ncbi:MAG: helix-turn-helix domain-containing protein [Gammaproteobacteria bacterium]|nr:helix-turn-helix domain-containing protein [Gammaproteobacteria bacterium]
MNVALQENIKKLMIKHGNISVSDLAKATGLPQPTLYQLYTGVTENPRKKTLQALAHYFSVTVNQLLGKDALPAYLPEKIKAQLDLNTAPLLTWDDLYRWPDHINFEHKKEIFLDKQPNKQTFAINMQGASMAPVFPDGCLLIFDGEKPIKNNDCAIILIKKTNLFVFKKISTLKHCTYAKSINPTFDSDKSTQLTEQDEIIATLLEARLTF